MFNKQNQWLREVLCERLPCDCAVSSDSGTCVDTRGTQTVAPCRTRLGCGGSSWYVSGTFYHTVHSGAVSRGSWSGIDLKEVLKQLRFPTNSTIYFNQFGLIISCIIWSSGHCQLFK